MNSETQKRLYEMEVIPPAAVWAKLSITIDEINEDNRVAKRVLTTELSPPAGVWEKIDSTINVVEKKPVSKKGVVINLRKLAAAALFIGIIVTGWVLFNNNNKKSAGVARIEPRPQKPSSDTNAATRKINDANTIDSSIDRSTLTQPDLSLDKELASISRQQQTSDRRNNLSGRRTNRVVQPATAQFASLNEPLGKSFNEPIDDLSLVTSDQNYLTMVNANGRLVKIPAQLASLAPHLQDKPVSDGYGEVLFGEGAYWKETLDEWRKRVVSAPVSAGDAFTSFVELLKNVQNR